MTQSSSSGYVKETHMNVKFAACMTMKIYMGFLVSFIVLYYLIMNPVGSDADLIWYLILIF